jgi:hypothetical protein
MAEDETRLVETATENEPEEADEAKKNSRAMDLLKIVAMPLVTLFLGFLFNASLNLRQENDSRLRLYTEMMGRREQADSDLRKDMFKSILDSFMSKDPKLERAQQIRQEVLNLELLAYNFNESLDIGPLFKDMMSQIPDQEQGLNVELRKRLEKAAEEVTLRQLTVLSDGGMVESGNTLPRNIKNLQAYLTFGSHTLPNPAFKPGEGVGQVCLSMDSTDEVQQFHKFRFETVKARHYRQFKLEVIDQDPPIREVQMRLDISQVLSEAECQHVQSLDEKPEIESNFWVGLFDFPMIDNTRLTHGERCSVSVTALTPNVLTVALAYFSGSRASLKDNPYYDEVMHDLLHGDKTSEPNERVTSR